jgi:hypothetical protein
MTLAVDVPTDAPAPKAEPSAPAAACPHCGNPDPGEQCRFCNTRMRTIISFAPGRPVFA